METSKDCYIFDIDGTLADCTHRLHYVTGKKRDYEGFFGELSKDAPIKATIDLTHALSSTETDILIVSGRPDNYLDETIKWLDMNGVRYDRTFFRQAGDFRPDHIVKKEILDQILKDGYNVLAVFDDRPSVVAMWRENGLICYQNEWHGDKVMPDHQTTLAIMVGPTCAGKSTYIKNNHKFDNFAVVSSDDLRMKMCGNFQDQTKNDEVFKLAHKLIKLYLESGIDVVFDATNIRNKDRISVVNCAPPTTQIEYHVINRTMEEKYRDGGWRNDLGFDLIAKHEQTFRSNLKDILSGRLPGIYKNLHIWSNLMFDHISRSIPNLKQKLDEEFENGNVIKSHKDDLALYCYSKKCSFDRNWNDVTISARGIVLTPDGEIVATPFPKFFNWGERDQTWPAEPFHVYEKLDGSLIIAFWHNGEWHTATKGSFHSEQAQWAREKLKGIKKHLVPGITYLFEAIYKENRIVINYDFEDLVLLGAYESSGVEIPFLELSWFYEKLGFRCAKIVKVSSFSELMDRAKTLSVNEEGWVIRFKSGLRLKVKGEEYKRVHNLISNLTPLSVWEILKNGGNINQIRQDLPEEFIDDFDTMVNLFRKRVNDLRIELYKKHDLSKHLTDKEIGLSSEDFGAIGKKGIFLLRKGKESSLDNLLWDQIRPAANKMDL